ncbi:MAG: hypothetical protein HYU36_15360 [Planctomycetes bacterium]|nr:hypothetical protein [Planctomycetota bacterium]
MFRLLFLVTLVLFVLGAVYLPWWVFCLIILGIIFGIFITLKLLGGWLVKALFSVPFKLKGAVLKGAEAEIHSLAPAAPPERKKGEEDEEAAGDAGRRQYFLLEATVTPRPSRGKFTVWEPGELLLVRPGSAIDDDDDSCRIESLALQEDGQFKPDEGYKFEGPKRLRMLIGVIPEVRQFQFRYYFETFGQVALP